MTTSSEARKGFAPSSDGEPDGIRNQVLRTGSRMIASLRRILNLPVLFGYRPQRITVPSLIFFPCLPNRLSCGLTGIVYYKNVSDNADEPEPFPDLAPLMKRVEKNLFSDLSGQGNALLEKVYLGGRENTERMAKYIRSLKNIGLFHRIYEEKDLQQGLVKLSNRLTDIIEAESEQLTRHMGVLSKREVEAMSKGVEALRDILWGLREEILANLKKIEALFPKPDMATSKKIIRIFKNINAVLNSIDRLEVRGRDSAGISLMFTLEADEFQGFMETLENVDLKSQFEERNQAEILMNNSITVRHQKENGGKGRVAITLVYKVAAEIGSLGDNIIFLRWQIKNDQILHTLVNFSYMYHTVLCHTRWASIGAITEPNCHPVDNQTLDVPENRGGIIHVCLNGDIDNYIELKTELEANGCIIHEEIGTDTKIIPLQVQAYLSKGHDIETAFRRAVNDFEGSHAISMHTDIAPGKLFLAQKGSGQTIFVGLAKDHMMPASEVYGFVEETPYYLKMDGEKVVTGKNGDTQGQIFVLNQDAKGPQDGLKAMYYDGTPFAPTTEDPNKTEITSRDIDRQEFPHYFLKEISESPASVEKTLQNRWKIREDGGQLSTVTLDDATLPEKLRSALVDGQIRRICFVGQGTAGVAALTCANILEHYMKDTSLYISALKASELSGFKIDPDENGEGMADALVVAISQSGTTTDTNRTVDMVKERGAYTLAIVNRRDSDVTFKVDGVMYTSSGRDIEMSVASTKAFYSQIVAGALLSLKMAELTGRRKPEFISAEIDRLRRLPDHMRKILAMAGEIKASARKHTTTKTYWAAVGSGPNKASADEIRIKLSELCYKTISSDFVEDKKHIDLSSEPLIIVCAAGVRPTVIGDIIKDTAIFKAHKATPIVITNEGEHRFDTYAADVFKVPLVTEHLSPIVNTLAGHIWGYYAALTINDGSKFLFSFREKLQKTIDQYAADGLNVFELVVERSFREKIVQFYRQFRQKKAENGLPTAMGLEAASDLTLLLKYLAGKLPVPDFEIDFGKKGTALNMINTLMECLGDAINNMARPVDAIKHQAKTVTVGTSRISEAVEGILFDSLSKYNISISRITNRNVIVLKNLQGIVSRIEGAILYRIDNLDLLGGPTENTTIEVVKKEGILKPIPSRVESDTRLKGTKRIIVREKNVWIGVGKKDDRNIVMIPVISASASEEDIIDNLLLLNISFKENPSLPVKIKALGGKFERIKNIVQESSIEWLDDYIELVKMEDLFGLSAEKIGDRIASTLS